MGARFAPNVPWAQKSFWMHPMVLLGYEAQLETHFSLFGDSANLDAIKVYVLRQEIIDLEIVFDTIDGSPRGLGFSRLSFRSA
jgi:hypothetical protein